MRFSVCLAAVALSLSTACATPRIEASAPIFPSPAATSAMPQPPPNAQTVRVVRVVDGDTIVIDGGRRARLIGIDAPEVHGSVACLGREASAYTKHALSGKSVVMDFDVELVDRYGRALVYVWSSDRSFFNGRIVADGFAVPMTVPPNVRYAELFVDLAAHARAAKRGLWSAC